MAPMASDGGGYLVRLPLRRLCRVGVTKGDGWKDSGSADGQWSAGSRQARLAGPGHLHSPGQARLWGRAEQSIALETVPGPGRQQRVEPPAPKWQNSGSSTAHIFFHGDSTAALPQGPTGCPLLSPEWPQRRVCGQELRVQSPATERGSSWARMCPDGPRGYFQIPPPPASASGPCPHLRAHLLLPSGSPSSRPSLALCLHS